MVAACAIAAGALPAGALAQVGYPGPSFASSTPTPFAPSADKPQNKLWFHDGIWWGSLFSPAAGSDGNGGFTIHRLDLSTQTWVDTGTPIDERNSSRADTLPDGSQLYVASLLVDSPGSVRLMRYQYDPGAKVYRLDAGFPVAIPAPGPVETISLEKDSRGNLWVAYESGGDAYVAHTSGNDAVFGAPYVIPVPRGATGLDPDDIAAVVSYGRRIGVMWSNQGDGAMYFASHRDGRGDGAADWSLDTALRRPGYADDHINLKSLQGDSAGRIFAAVKTSLDDNPASGANAPQVLLLVLRPGSKWTRHVFGRVRDDHTRPIVLTNRRTRKLYMFATAPTEGGSIYYKETSLDRISFPRGRGKAFIQSSGDPQVNDASSTRQDLSSAPTLVVLASDGSTSRYLHNVLSLRDRTRPKMRRLRVRPGAFTASRRATIVFTLSESARVRFRVERAGRVRGTFSRPASAGRNRVRLRRRGLRPGRYRLVAVATDGSGNRSRPRGVGFRITSP